jgi:TolB-like protein/DNA-binding winged helix-turn-helix (wHTH) protein
VSDASTIRIGAWTASPALNLLERDGHSTKIEPRAMDVLMVLARHSGGVVSVDELLASVWKGVVVGDGSVYLAINQLRGVLDAGSEGPSHIETIPKRGYRLVVPVDPAGVQQAAGRAASSAPQSLPRERRLGWLLAGVVAGSLLLVSASLLRDSPQPAASTSVAVLPFVNISSDPEQEYFADGITEELSNALSRIRDLHVTGRTSAFYFKGRNEDVRTIGAALDVEHILEGSVRRSQDRVRITAQLVNARTGYHLWSHTYERTLDDAFVIQDEIAQSVANALQITLGVGAPGRVPGMTRNIAAYDEYLRGVSLAMEFTAASYPPAIEHLQRAVTHDPSFAVAWAMLCNVYRYGAVSVPSRAEAWRRKGAEALARARELTPDAPDVLVQTTLDLVERSSWLEAGAVHARAVAAYAQSGMNVDAALARGFLLVSVGRAREAVESFERARAIDPLMVTASVGLADAHLGAGNLRAAITEIDRGLGLEGLGSVFPTLRVVAALALRERAEIDKSLALFPAGNRVGEVGRTLARLDEPTRAPTEIRRLAASASANDKIMLAEWAAYYSEPELALVLLRDALSEALQPGVLWGPLLGDVRELQQFKELVRDLGLVDYWRVHGWSDFCRPVTDDDFVCE